MTFRSGPYYLRKEAVSLRLTPLQFTCNKAAGIEVTAVKAAIMFKISYSKLQAPEQTDYFRFENLVRAQIMAGALEADPYDLGDPLTDDPSDDILLVHTPFVDAGGFPQVGFNAFSDDVTGTQPFVRVIVTMRRTGGAANAAPIYFVQDYAAEIFTSSTVSGTMSGLGGSVPFGLYRGSTNLLNTSNIISSGVSPVSISGHVARYGAFVNLLFTTNPVAFSYDAPLYGKATLTAGNSIAITCELAVPPNNELVMETNRAALLQCSPTVITAVGPTTCIANTWALRSSGKTEPSPPPTAHRPPFCRSGPRAGSNWPRTPLPAVPWPCCGAVPTSILSG